MAAVTAAAMVMACAIIIWFIVFSRMMRMPPVRVMCGDVVTSVNRKNLSIFPQKNVKK